MDVRTAAFHVVHDIEGGTSAVAEFLGKARNTIDHEVRPPQGSTYKLGLFDAVKITKRYQDFRILYAFADECDHICLPAPSAPTDPDGTTEKVLAKACNLSREIAKTFEKMNSALADGSITAGEFADFEQECGQVVAAIGTVVRAMRAKMDGDLSRRHAAVEDARRGGK